MRADNADNGVVRASQCNDLMRQNQEELKQQSLQAKVKTRESEESTLQRVQELEVCLFMPGLHFIHPLFAFLRTGASA